MRFLIAYDIADDKRLRNVAKVLERWHAQRVQKSVFLYVATPPQLRSLMVEVLREIDIYQDVVQAWPIAAETHQERIDLGQAWPTHPDCLIVGQNEMWILEDRLCLNG